MTPTVPVRRFEMGASGQGWVKVAQKIRIDAILEFYRAAAREGRRCPTQFDQRSAFGTIRFGESPGQLARQGLITRVEVYGKNWRVVEIDGLRTAPYIPKSGKGLPYRVIDKTGDHWIRR